MTVLMAHDSAAHDSANIDSNVDAIHDNNNNYNDDDDDQVDADDVDDDRDEVDTTNPTNMATKTAPGTDSSISSYLLPLSSITKVCKQVLPESMSIQKDSKAVLQKATTLFISYLSTTARDQGGDKKTMSVDQVYRALSVMELDSVLLNPVKELVEINNEKVKLKRDEYRQKAKLKSSSKTEEEIEAEIDRQVLEEMEDEQVLVPAKRRAEGELERDEDQVME